MELYLLRHGAAERTSPSGQDADRRLTEAGQAAVRQMARRMAMLGVTLSAVVSSPYVRARETARIAAEVLGYEGGIATALSLLPESTPSALWNEIRAHPDAPALLLVGHQPLLSEALMWMVSGTETARFPTAGVACVDVQDLGPTPRATLRFLMTPASA